MKATTIKDTLIAAHWILTHYGWCQGSYYIDNKGQAVWDAEDVKPPSLGGCCLNGALDLVDTEGLKTRTDAEYLLTKVAKSKNKYNIAEWNDNPKRTKEQVLDLLNQAIAKA
jgi:hypothetical protein